MTWKTTGFSYLLQYSIFYNVVFDWNIWRKSGFTQTYSWKKEYCNSLSDNCGCCSLILYPNSISDRFLTWIWSHINELFILCYTKILMSYTLNRSCIHAWFSTSCIGCLKNFGSLNYLLPNVDMFCLFSKNSHVLISPIKLGKFLRIENGQAHTGRFKFSKIQNPTWKLSFCHW